LAGKVSLASNRACRGEPQYTLLGIEKFLSRK
jgi:hypothetical protein